MSNVVSRATPSVSGGGGDGAPGSGGHGHSGSQGGGGPSGGGAYTSGGHVNRHRRQRFRPYSVST